MEPIYQLSFTVDDLHADRFGRLKSSSILYFVQEAAGRHWQYIEAQTGQNCQLYWVITRHRVQVTRLPRKGETVHLETWPMPTTRVAYPRSVVAYDQQGDELFRSVSLWVLMDADTRAMILPGKSGVEVAGIVLGDEPAIPTSLPPKVPETHLQRKVLFSDLDYNGHMNNCKYLDWVADLLTCDFHREHTPKEIVLNYLSEAREGEALQLAWELSEEGCLMVQTQRLGESVSANHSRVFAAQIQL
jgi:medium-chain acyl-[acyl-carrier-protein] hydrolase